MALVEEGSDSTSLKSAPQRPPTVEADFIIHTGNVQRCNHLQAQLWSSTQLEVLTALKCTMQCWKKHFKHDFVMSREVIGHPKLMSPSLPGNPGAKRVNVKLFVLCEFEEGMVNKAVSAVERAVGFAGVDSLVIAFPERNVNRDSDAWKQLMSAWHEMQILHEYKLAHHLGVADVDINTITAINSNSKVPVHVCEVDALALKCNLPPQLRTFALEHSVRLIAHSDRDNPLPRIQLQRIMTKVIKNQSIFTPVGETVDAFPSPYPTEPIHVDWMPRWVARYTVVDTERSVIDSTGYAICARYMV
eukprot:gene1866-4963_t